MSADRLRRSRRQERTAARDYGGRVQPGSGNTPIPSRKNDVRTDTELVECKTTEHESFVLKLSELLKAGRAALLAGKRMVFEVEIASAFTYVVLEKSDYLEMRHRLGEE